VNRTGAAGQAAPDPAGAVYRRLLGYAKPYRGMYLLGVVGMLLYAASQFAIVKCVKILTASHGSFFAGHTRALLYLPLAVIAMFLLRGVGDFMANYFPGWVGRQVIKSLRAELFAKYLGMSTSYYDRESTATLLTRLTYNVELVAEATTNSITVVIRDSLTVLGLLGYLFWLNWQLAIFALLAAPGIAWLVRSVNQRFRRYSARIQSSVGDVTRVAKEVLDGHRVVKVFNAQEHLRQVFEGVNERNRRTNMRLVSARSSSSPAVQLIAALGLAAVLFVANLQISAGRLLPDDFLVFLTAMLLTSDPLKRLITVAGPLQQGIAAGANVFEALDAPVEPQGGARALQRARGDVEFEHVDFSYAGEKGPVLRDIQLKVPAGTTVAIVGRSGSGKSTLVSLLPRFYDPVGGVLRLDGVDVRDYRLHDLREQISLVSQDIVLFNDSIRNNITFGAAGIGEQQVRAAAQAAYVLEFADQLPQGLDTPVGDRGMQLSGGQRQRVAIARALLRNSPILILDEATSALDTASERYIQAALEQLVRNRTTFIIAHRLSTIEGADLIVVMRDGAIVEQGTHAALLAQGGVYTELHRLQFSD